MVQTEPSNLLRKNKEFVIVQIAALSWFQMNKKSILFSFIFRRKAIVFLVVFFIFGLNQSAFSQTIRKEISYFENGKRMQKGKWKGDQKIGTWLYYHPSGYMLAQEKWRNGKMRWRIEYNEKHYKVRGLNAKGEEIIYKGCNCNH